MNIKFTANSKRKIEKEFTPIIFLLETVRWYVQLLFRIYIMGKCMAAGLGRPGLLSGGQGGIHHKTFYRLQLLLEILIF